MASGEPLRRTRQSRRGAGIRPNVWVSGFVSLLTDVSSEMLVPILPLFLSGTLGAPAVAIGLIEGLAETLSSLTKSASGWLSDRVGRRKPLMALGYGLSNGLKPLLGFTTGWGQVLTLRVADRLGKGIRSAPRDALLADSSSPDQYGRTFGLHRALDTAGAAIGPLAAWWILRQDPGDYRAVFWWAALPGGLAVLLLLLFIRETGAGRRNRPGDEGPFLRQWSLDLGRLTPPLRRFLLVVGLFGIGNSADAFLILRAESLGVAAAWIPLAYFSFNAVYSLLSLPAGLLSDRLGRRSVLVAGFAAFAAVYAGFALAGAAWQAWLLFPAYGIHHAFTEGVQKAYVADLAPEALRGTALGALHAVVGLTALPASLAAGWLWEVWGPRGPFWWGAATAGASALLLLSLPSGAGGSTR